MSEPDITSWAELVDQFIDYLADEERSDHTKRNYHDDLLVFKTWYCGRFDREPDLSRLVKRDLVEWKQSIEATGGRKGARASVPTVNRKLAALRSFIRWAQDHDLAPRLDPPRPSKRQGAAAPRSLTWAERSSFIRTVEAAENPQHDLIMRLGLDGGLRVAEMAGLKGSDVAISERKATLKVHGKGRKVRMVPMSRPLREAFEAHGSERYQGKDRAVLQGRKGPLTIRGIQDIVERYGKRTPVGKRIGLQDFSTHSLRHTCAYWWLNHPRPEKRLSVIEVAGLLGHSDVKVTMLYATPHEEEVASRVAQLDD